MRDHRTNQIGRGTTPDQNASAQRDLGLRIASKSVPAGGPGGVPGGPGRVLGRVPGGLGPFLGPQDHPRTPILDRFGAAWGSKLGPGPPENGGVPVGFCRFSYILEILRKSTKTNGKTTIFRGSGAQLRPPCGPKSVQNRRPGGSWGPRNGPKPPGTPPKTLPGPPGTPPGPPEDPPGPPQRAPRSSRDPPMTPPRTPRDPREAPRRPPGAPQVAPGAPREPSRTPRDSTGAPRTTPRPPRG